MIKILIRFKKQTITKIYFSLTTEKISSILKEDLEVRAHEVNNFMEQELCCYATIFCATKYLLSASSVPSNFPSHRVYGLRSFSIIFLFNKYKIEHKLYARILYLQSILLKWTVVLFFFSDPWCLDKHIQEMHPHTCINTYPIFNSKNYFSKFPIPMIQPQRCHLYWWRKNCGRLVDRPESQLHPAWLALCVSDFHILQY